MVKSYVSNLLSCVTAVGLAGAMAAAYADPRPTREAVSSTMDWLRNSYAAMVQENALGAEASSDFLAASVQRGTLEQVVTATGLIQPVQTVEVGSQLPGQISKIFVDFNDKVHRGDPLAELDQRTFIAKVDEARSALDMAIADVQVQQAKLDRARADLANARANRSVLAAKLDSATALKAAAERNLDRKIALRAREAVAVTAVDDAQTDLASRAAQTRESTSILDLNGYAVEAAAADVRRIEAELEQSKSAIPLRQASLRVAEIDLERTVIRSPIDGVVVGRFVDQGQTLASGLEVRTVFNIAHDLREMEVHARVDETDIGRMAAGQHATFSVDAYPGKQFEALIRQVRQAPSVSQNVVTYTVVLTTSNQQELLFPGMTALIKLVVHKEDGVLKMPLAALRFRPDAGSNPALDASSKVQAVWVRRRDGWASVPVRTGASSADQIVLKDGGLREGDQVAVGQATPAMGRQFLGIRFGS